MRYRIAIIYNAPNPDIYGTSVEKQASLAILDGVKAINQALTESGHTVAQLPLLPPLESAKASLKGLEADLVFNLFEGFDGCPETEITVANFLSELGITYTGCHGSALSVGLDKVKMKARLAATGIDTPRYQLLGPKTIPLFNLNYPCIVKPCAEDGSNGISEESVVHDFASLEKQVTTISNRFGRRALVEEFIDGREFNITVLGTSEPRALPVSEIVYSLPPETPRILSFSAKWDPESIYFTNTKATCPAEIDNELRERICQTALLAFRLLGSRGYARVDFRLNSEEQLKVIEVNPNPDISPDAGAALQAQVAGMTYKQFIEQIVQLAL
ncbi:MAG: ATP-grasp domain-containing protein [Chloroflexota bacterium]|nr:MAG: ATP-grasp domain-containing protein [Chloroflexota bacterium]